VKTQPPERLLAKTRQALETEGDPPVNDRQPDALIGVALLVGEPPTWLRTTSVRVAEDDMPRIRDAVEQAQARGRSLTPGEWVDALVVWGRIDRRPLPMAVTAAPGDVASLRALMLDLDR